MRPRTAIRISWFRADLPFPVALRSPPQHRDWPVRRAITIWVGARRPPRSVPPAAGRPPTTRQETRMSPRRPCRPLALVLPGLLAAVAFHAQSRAVARQKNAASPKDPDPAAVERTRATVKLLDDVHKGYVV